MAADAFADAVRFLGAGAFFAVEVVFEGARLAGVAFLADDALFAGLAFFAVGAFLAGVTFFLDAGLFGLAKALAAGERLAGARLVAHGLDEINEWLRDGLSTWRELHSVRLTTTVETLRVSLPRNRYFVSRGARMVSFFDYFRTDPMARLLLSAEQEGEYYFCYAPVQMKILERRTVLLEGPPSEGQPTLMAVTHPGCLAAANAYWRALEASAFPCTKAGSDVEELSPRQRRIISLLAADCSDEQIAKLVREHFDLRPKGIIQMLDLLRPIYQKTAAYGHFGRDEPEFSWERTDRAAALRAAAGL